MSSKKNKKPPIPLALRIEVLERDGYRCTFCKMTNSQHVAVYGNELSCHHILLTGSLPLNVRNDKISDLLSICSNCHTVYHAITRRLIDYLRSPGNHLMGDNKK